MKKKIKIILTILLIVISLIVVYVILVIKGILSNPLLDTKDLVCMQENIYSGNKVDWVITFKFDKNAIIKSYTESYVYFIDDEERMKKTVEHLNKNNKNYILNGNKLTVYTDYYMEKDKGYYGKNKKEIKKLYIYDYSYMCE